MTKQDRAEKELKDFCERYRDMAVDDILEEIHKRINYLPLDLFFLEVIKDHDPTGKPLKYLAEGKILLDSLQRSNTRFNPDLQIHVDKF